jgi:ABC-type phosphate transport system substrate-binding protein
LNSYVIPQKIKSVITVVFTILGLCLTNPCSSESYSNDIAIITNVNNDNLQISQSEAINIFMGRYRRFSDGSKAIPIDNGSIKNMFYMQLVNKSPSEIKAYWATLIFSGRTQPPKDLEDTNHVINAVKQEPQAIAYIPANQVNNKVKVLLILRGRN